jgi:hypothetical protein
MQFQLLATLGLPLDRQLQWLWHSTSAGGFLVGDDKSAYLLPTSSPAAAVKLAASDLPVHHACNLPIPADVYDHFATEPWHGFGFLKRSEYDRALDRSGHGVGDLLRTLVFGPDYGLHVRHPSSGLVLGLRSGSMELLRMDGDQFVSLEKTKTRGRAALAFAAHPTEPMIAYGDNGGTFHLHRFGETGFGKASKFAARERKASRVEFVQSGQTLIVGGMGYLETYVSTGGKFVLSHGVAIAVRDFVCVNDGAAIFVNQGMQGISVYQHDANGFQTSGSVPSAGAVNQMVVSGCGRFLAITRQESAEVCVYRIGD